MNKAKAKGLNITEGFGGYFNEEESVLSKIAKNAKNGSLEYKMPITLGRPQNNSAVIAQDSCALNNVNLFKDEWSSLYPQFIGYSSLSLLQQEPLIRAGVEALVDDMTRKFIKIVGKGDTDLTEKISQIEEDLDYFKVKDIFNKADTLCGYQGGCLVYIDVGPLDDETKKSPLVFDPILFPKNQFRGFKVIEPINVYPGCYNTSDPTSEDYYNPETWYILGKEYHKSRFLYFTQNEMPLLLKPIYNFFGLSLSQQVLDYVDKFAKNREAMQRLLNKFSLTYIATDMSQVLSPGSGCNNASSFANLKRRGQLLARQRSNDGILFYDKQKEEIGQLNTPLAGVADIVASSLDMLPIIFGESKDKYYGDLPKGLNASSEGTNRIYYDKILSLNEKINSANISRVLELLQVNRGYEIDHNITFDYIPLWEMDEKERAELNKTIADTDAVYLDRGVLSPAEIRNRLAHDVNNDYNSIDPDDVPDNEFDNITDIDDEDKAGEVFDSSPRQDKIDYVMNEFKEGRLKSSDGKLVTDKGQALAIAYSEAEKLAMDGDEEKVEWITTKQGVYIPLEVGQTKKKAIQKFISSKDNIVDFTNKFKKSPSISEVREYINEIVNNGSKFTTLSPDWLIDVKGGRKKKDHLIYSSQYRNMSEPDRRRHNEYIKSLEDLLSEAQYSGSKPNYKKEEKPNIEKYHYFTVKAKFGEKIYKLSFNTEQYVNETEDKPQTVHLYDVLEIE